MRHLIVFTSLFLSELSQAQSFFERANSFFSEYVAEGKVAYEAIKEDPARLNELVLEIAELDLFNKRVTPEFLKAFYINAYNILVIKQVVDHYPIKSPWDINGFFDGIKHQVMEQQLTLDELEKQTLFAQFPDPRLHFVLVCAADGCPPLASFSYQPEQLEKQLTERTSDIMNLDGFIRVKGDKALLSKIFDWYAEDFGASKEAVVAYINQHRDKKIDTSKAISYYHYDWSLNEK